MPSPVYHTARDGRTVKRTAHGEGEAALLTLLLVAGEKVCATTAQVPQSTEPGTPSHGREGWRGLLRHRTAESRDQQLPGLQREATCSLQAIRAAKGGWRRLQPLLLSQDPCQANSRPAIRRGVCWPLFCSSLAEVRFAVRTRKSRPPGSTAHYNCSVRQPASPPTSFHSQAGLWFSMLRRNIPDTQDRRLRVAATRLQ